MARLLPADADLLVPVPLHRWRLWSRGFNQAALIAAAMTKASGVASDPTLLVRRRRTPPLRGMGPRASAQPVAGPFEFPEPPTPALGDQRVVLIPCVHTTGYTAYARNTALPRAGGARTSEQ